MPQRRIFSLRAPGNCPDRCIYRRFAPAGGILPSRFRTAPTQVAGIVRTRTGILEARMMERQLFALSLGFAGLILLAAAARGDLPAQAPDAGATRLAAVAAPQAKGLRPRQAAASQRSFSDTASNAQVTNRKNSAVGMILTSRTPASTAIDAGTISTAATFRLAADNWPSAQ